MDKITGFWIKNLSSLHPMLFTLFQHTLKGDIEIPDWLILSNTILLPKNTETQLAKNYSVPQQNI